MPLPIRSSAATTVSSNLEFVTITEKKNKYASEGLGFDRVLPKGSPLIRKVTLEMKLTSLNFTYGALLTKLGTKIQINLHSDCSHRQHMKGNNISLLISPIHTQGINMQSNTTGQCTLQTLNCIKIINQLYITHILGIKITCTYIYLIILIPKILYTMHHCSTLNQGEVIIYILYTRPKRNWTC